MRGKSPQEHDCRHGKPGLKRLQTDYIGPVLGHIWARDHTVEESCGDWDASFAQAKGFSTRYLDAPLGVAQANNLAELRG